VNHHVSKLAAVLLGAAVALTSGCAAIIAPHKEVINAGNITVLAVDGTAHLTHITPFHNTMYASSLDGHDNEAAALNDALRKANYDVVMKSDTSFLFTLLDLYAGPADQYRPVAENPGSNVLATTGKQIGTIALCATLHLCSNPLTAVDDAAFGANQAGMNALSKASGDKKQLGTRAISLVVSQICFGNSCGVSYASSTDPTVTLDQLRVANASLGMPKILRAEP